MSKDKDIKALLTKECWKCGGNLEKIEFQEYADFHYICEDCGRKYGGSSSSTCTHCDGTGYIETLGYNGQGKPVSAEDPCPYCDNSPSLL